MKFWQFLLASVFGIILALTLGIAVVVFAPKKKREPITLDLEPRIYDVCRYGVGQHQQCYTVALYEGLYHVNDGQIWAMSPNGWLFYADDIVYVGKCYKNCEVGD